MPEPKTAEALAQHLKVLYCKHTQSTHRRGAYCEICAVTLIKAYARQEVEAWKEQAVTIVRTGYTFGSHTKIQDKIAKTLHALPVEPA